MSGDLKIVQLPVGNLLDVPLSLRKLADQIEAGDYHTVHRLAWVIQDCDGNVHVGIIGGVQALTAEACYMYSLGVQRCTERSASA